MNSSTISANQRFCISLSRFSSLFAIVMGSMVLVGWTFNIEVLKSIIPHLSTMNPMTAVCFILLGISLLINHFTYKTFNYWIATACALFVLSTALSRFGNILFGYHFNPDQLLYTAKLGANHMAPNTAFNFIILSVSQLSLRHSRRAYRHFLILLAFMISFMALVGYAYDVHALYEMPTFISMALNTATTFFILSCGMLCFDPDYGFMHTLTNEGSSGTLTRQILPQGIITLVALGWLRLMGQRLGFYSSEVGVLIFLFLVMVVFIVLIWNNAIILERIDMERQKQTDALKEANDKLQVLSLTDPLTGVFNRRGFESHVQERFKLAKRNKQIAFLFFVDIDKMKWINDTLGHKEGDLVLVEVVNILKKCCRDTDIIARLGGDEFSMFLILTNAGDENVVIKRLQEHIDLRNAACQLPRHPFSLSMGGVACDTQEIFDFEKLIAHADKKMYINKGLKKRR